VSIQPNWLGCLSFGSRLKGKYVVPLLNCHSFCGLRIYPHTIDVRKSSSRNRNRLWQHWTLLGLVTELTYSPALEQNRKREGRGETEIKVKMQWLMLPNGLHVLAKMTTKVDAHSIKSTSLRSVYFNKLLLDLYWQAWIICGGRDTQMEETRPLK
jgi:hypothetical protein